MYQEIIERLKTIPKSTILIAIDGHSATGKSTLAAKIQTALPQVTVIHTDDFYRPMPIEQRSALDAEGGYQHYYDWQRLEMQVLKPLAQGLATRYQKYDWSTNHLGVWSAHSNVNGIFVIEGCYSARPQLRKYYDLTIFCDTQLAIRNERQRQRGDDWRWIERWHAAEDYYIETFRPQEFADFCYQGAA